MPDLVDLVRANVRHAKRTANEILNDPTTVVLDTETTGLVDGSYVVDIAVIARGKSLVNTLINPQVRIPPDASRIHGIFDRDVKDAPTFPDIWPELSQILGRSRIVIYNASYDLRILQNELNRLATNESPSWRVDDAMKIYQQWYFAGIGRSGRHQTRLVDPHCDAPKCQSESRLHTKAAHRAYADCQATVRRLRMIAETCWLDDHYRKARRSER